MIAGAVAWTVPAVLVHPGGGIVLVGAGLAALAAPLCDLDNPGAFASWRKHPVKHPVSRVVALAGKHRQGPTHSFLVLGGLGLFAVGAVFAFAPRFWWLPLAAAVGLLSHPLIDLLNRVPVRWLWPLPGRVALFVMPVGGVGEYVVRAGLAVALAWLLMKGLRA